MQIELILLIYGKAKETKVIPLKRTEHSSDDLNQSLTSDLEMNNECSKAVHCYYQPSEECCEWAAEMESDHITVQKVILLYIDCCYYYYCGHYYYDHYLLLSLLLLL